MRKLCRNLLPAYATIVALAMASALVACSDKVAGGVSEETNTVAGLLATPEGRPVASVVVYLSDYETNEVAFVDTTDSEGRFGMPVKNKGKYGISGHSNSLAFYKTFEFKGDSISLEPELKEATDLTGTLTLRPDSDAVGIAVSIPGSIWSTVSDASGKFTLEKVPSGVVPVAAKSPDLQSYENACFLALVKEGAVVFRGPVPIEKIEAFSEFVVTNAKQVGFYITDPSGNQTELEDSLANNLQPRSSSSTRGASSNSQTITIGTSTSLAPSSSATVSPTSSSYIVVPASYSEGESDLMPVGHDTTTSEPVFDSPSSSSGEATLIDGKGGYGDYGGNGYLVPIDVYEDDDPTVIQFPVSEDYGVVANWDMENLARDGIALYGGAASAPGFDNNAIQFADASQYGVIENDGGILDGAKALVVEAWINVKTASVAAGAPAYLVHKPRPTGAATVFALALANNFCNKSGTRLVFGVPSPTETSLGCSTTAISNKTIELDTWIYVTAIWDGKYVSLYQDGNIVSRRQVSQYDIESGAYRVTFGGGNANVKLDNVRFGVLPITADDVLYRYFIGGAL